MSLNMLECRKKLASWLVQALSSHLFGCVHEGPRANDAATSRGAKLLRADQEASPHQQDEIISNNNK